MPKEDTVPSAPARSAGSEPSSALNQRYVVESELSRGGMGRVFVARDIKLGRRVAIKFLAPGIHDDDELRRFEQEARAAGSLNHPNVLTVHDIGIHDGNPYIVSELLEGGTLRERLGGMPLAIGQAIDYATQLADGLAAAHDRGIVHRDLKPENLFVTQDGRLKILDFGIAKLVVPEPESSNVKPPAQTQTGAILGTIGYMSPEQVRGQTADRRSDIFSAGAIIYEMLSGQRAFQGSSLVETGHSILHDDPPELPEQLPLDLQEIVWRCLEKQPEERFQSAGELLLELRKLSPSSGAQSDALSVPATGKVTAADDTLLGYLRRARWLLLGAGALLVVLLVGLNFAPWRERLRSESGMAKEAAKPPAGLIKSRPAIAVLGFRNLSKRSDQGWLSTALSEMISTELAAGEKLRTIPQENVARMKTELALGDSETLAKESLVRVRKNLGADLVVLGAYVHLGKEAGGQMRLDVRLQDAAAGETIASFAEAGTDKDLFEMVLRTGARLRQKLGIGEVSSAEAAGVRASMPSDPDVARLYSQGLAKLRVFDALGARDLLEKVVAADPNHALAHSALSDAWSKLGYDARARDEARNAFNLSVGLSREERLGVEARYRETTREWNKAIEIHRTLWDFFPDNVDYGVRLAQAQISSNKAKDALATVEALLKLSPPGRDDPRIDIAQAQAAYSLSDFKRAQEASARAASNGGAREAKLLVASARQSEGRALAKLGEPQKARVAFEEAQRIYAAAEYRAGVAWALNSIAYLQTTQGDLVGAKGTFEQALVVFRAVGNKSAEATILGNLANVLTNHGDVEGAKQMFEKALAVHRELGEKNGIATWLNGLGNILRSQGDLANAKKKFEESLAIAREIEDRSQISIALNGLAGVLVKQRDLAGAKEILGQVVAIRRETGEKTQLAFALNNLGEVLYQQGDLAAAQTSMEESLAIRKQLGEKGYVAYSELSLASLAMEEGRSSEAEELALKAVAEFQTQHAVDAEAQARVVLARSLLAQHQPDRAQGAIVRASDLAGKSQDRTIRLTVDIISSRIRASRGQAAAAKARLKATLAEATKHGLISQQLEARLALGEVEMESGESTAGRAHLKSLEKDATAKRYTLIARRAAAAKR